MRTRQKRVATDTWRSLGRRTTPLEHWNKRNCQISCKSNNRKDTFEGSQRTFGTDLVKTTGTTSVSNCRPAYCFRRRYKGAEKRSTGAYYKFWLACCTPGARFVCLFLIFAVPFAPDLLHSQIMRLDMTYRIVNQSINQSI